MLCGTTKKRKKKKNVSMAETVKFATYDNGEESDSETVCSRAKCAIISGFLLDLCALDVYSHQAIVGRAI